MDIEKIIAPIKDKSYFIELNEDNAPFEEWHESPVLGYIQYGEGNLREIFLCNINNSRDFIHIYGAPQRPFSVSDQEDDRRKYLEFFTGVSHMLHRQLAKKHNVFDDEVHKCMHGDLEKQNFCGHVSRIEHACNAALEYYSIVNSLNFEALITQHYGSIVRDLKGLM